jgi:hypothetical protein
LLWSWVRISPRAWTFVCFVYILFPCVGRGLCDSWSLARGVLPCVQLWVIKKYWGLKDSNMNCSATGEKYDFHMSRVLQLWEWALPYRIRPWTWHSACGSKHFWNVDQFARDYMPQHPRRQSSL